MRRASERGRVLNAASPGVYDRRVVLRGDPSDRRMTARMAAVVLRVRCVLALSAAVALALSAAVAFPKAQAASGSPSFRRVVLLGLRQRGNAARLATSPVRSRLAVIPPLSVAPSVPGSILGAGGRPQWGPALSPLAGRRRHCAAELGPVDRAGCRHRAGRTATVLRSRWRGAHARGSVCHGASGGGSRRHRRASSIRSPAALVTRAALPARPVTATAARTCAGSRRIRAFTPGQLSTAYGVDPLHSRAADRLWGPRGHAELAGGRHERLSHLGPVLRTPNPSRPAVRDAGGGSRHGHRP